MNEREVVSRIRALVADWREGRKSISARMVLDEVQEILDPPGVPEVDEAYCRHQLVVMEELMNQGDYEAAHSAQVRLYEAVLRVYGAAGGIIATEALKAADIVVRWE